jgi:hypothetical protein
VQALREHRMFLKNVVWRPDLKVFRLTWADADNALVFKVVYKVAHDPVLINSVYADKNAIVDIKIMFLQDGRYRYLHLNHLAQGVATIHGGQVKIGEGRVRTKNDAEAGPAVYELDGHLSADQCKFCHMLVPGVNGRPGGIFFPRYQESSLDGRYTGSVALRQPTFFKESDFRMIHPKDAPVPLPEGLPDRILFNRVDMTNPATKATYAMYARTMFESPEIVEALARDNHESVCISVDFGPAAPLFGRDNYVCADGVRRKLFVKFRNAMLSTGSGEIAYVIPYAQDH